MLVYKQYGQAALDSQYNNRLHVPNFLDYLNRWELRSRETEQELPVVTDIPYGHLPGERLDVYPSLQPHSKTLIFIHGGYWHMLDKSMFHFIAKSFFASGNTTVLLTYPLAPNVSLDQIVLSCRTAIGWLYQNVSTFNGDPQQLYVAGHSAGGHLAAMLMATDWSRLIPGIPANVLKGVCLLSGLFNLIPLRLSYLNTVLKMDEETALRNSPVRLQPLSTCPLIIAAGEEETEEFKDQSNELFDCWTGKGGDIQSFLLPRQNHYSIVEAMADPDAALHQAICQLMRSCE